MALTDPLSDALHAVASQVKDLRARVHKLEGTEPLDTNAQDELLELVANDYQI